MSLDERPWLRDTSGLHMNYGWSLLSNTPFRYYKHSSHEGALRSPLIVHWPVGVTRQRGAVLHQSCNVWDLYPTFLELAKTAYPNSYDGRPVLPLMGKSLLPALNGSAPAAGSEMFISSYARSQGLVAGDWKIVRYADSPWELYRISEDPVEQHDLRKTNPEQFSRLLKQWNAHFKQHPMAEPWELHENPQLRGFGHDRRERFRLTVSTPEFMEDNVATDTKLTLKFDGPLDFSNSEGRFIRLQKYGSFEILWQADPDPSNAAQGRTEIRFDDCPRLEPGTHYYITWDAGWARIRSGNATTTLSALQETAEAFRFRTRPAPLRAQLGGTPVAELKKMPYGTPRRRAAAGGKDEE
jgi:arylsulfatase